jgi:hypothetical protein
MRPRNYRKLEFVVAHTWEAITFAGPVACKLHVIPGMRPRNYRKLEFVVAHTWEAITFAGPAACKLHVIPGMRHDFFCAG